MNDRRLGRSWLALAWRSELQSEFGILAFQLPDAIAFGGQFGGQALQCVTKPAGAKCLIIERAPRSDVVHVAWIHDGVGTVRLIREVRITQFGRQRAVS
jgi:hypothetical protein